MLRVFWGNLSRFYEIYLTKKDTTLINFGNDVILTSYKFEIAIDLLILSI